jgi:Zn finger protein HypA/HybF involved in hydrogenase expression
MKILWVECCRLSFLFGIIEGNVTPFSGADADSAIKGSKLEKARIIRHYIEGEGQCSDCETIFPMNALFSPCPHCGSYLVKILKGKELRVKSIVIKKE